jgi:RHS repeat-associated protein
MLMRSRKAGRVLIARTTRPNAGNKHLPTTTTATGGLMRRTLRNQTSTAETAYDFNTGLVLWVKDDFGQITTTEYDDLQRPKRVNPIVVSGVATGPVTETNYGVAVNGQLYENQRFVKAKKQIDANNWDEFTIWFDGLGRTVKTVAKDSQGDVTVETHYDQFGRVDRTTSPYRSGDTVYWSKTRYDELGRAVESFAPATLTNVISNTNLVSMGITSFGISYVTNYVGTFVVSSDASGRKSRSIKNALGQLLRVDEPTAMGGSADADLGAIGSPAQPTYYKYDLYGNMVQVTQGVQNRYFKYDSLGRLIRVRQPEQEINTNLGLADSFNTSGQWTAAFTYDVLGNVVTATDAKHVTITNTYDRAGRVTTRGYYGETGTATPPVYFFYDGKGLASEQTPINYAKGKLTVVSSDISQTRYKLFDNFGRLKEMEQRTPATIIETTATATPRVSKYTYNLSGALVEEEYPSGRKVKNEFESDGDLKRIYGKTTANAAEQTYANSFTFTPDGKIEKLKLGNGLWESAKFNNRLQVTELALGHSVGDGNLWKLNYEYGELVVNGSTISVDTNKNTGNIARQTVNFSGLSHPFVQTYKYDPIYRLTEARETRNANQTWKQTFGYDKYGNRNAFTQDVGGTNLTINNLTLPVVDQNTNRFQTNPSQGYSYDKNGNITADPANSDRQFVFNGENKQAEVKDAGGSPIGKFYYDGEGKRVKKVVYPGTSNEETTVFVYSNRKLAAEYSTAQAPSNPNIHYTATDQLGSPRVLTGKYGEIISRRDFMPFGEELYADVQNRTTANKYSASGEDAVRKRFTGYEKDMETNLDFAEARYYNSQHARFTAVDPLLASGKFTNPQTFNRYVYVMNRPLTLTDSTGLQAGIYFPASDFGNLLNEIKNAENQLVLYPWEDSVMQDRIRGINQGILGYYMTADEMALAASNVRQQLEVGDYGYVQDGTFHPYDLSQLEDWQVLDLGKAINAKIDAGQIIDAGKLPRGSDIIPAIASSIPTPQMNFPSQQLQKKFKHAEDFGVKGNYNSKTAQEFQKSIENHISDPGTTVINGTFRGHYYNAQTGLNVMKDKAGNFLSGFKLNAQQAMNVTTRGSL